MGKRSNRNRNNQLLTSRLPLSQYPRAWAQYNRRWLLMWLGFLALIAYCIMILMFMHSHFPDFNKSERRTVFGFLMLPGIIACMLPYFWFNSWLCPRCGLSYSGDSKLPIRAERCQFCRLRRGSVPQQSTWRFSNQNAIQKTERNPGDQAVDHLKNKSHPAISKEPLPINQKNTGIPTDIICLFALFSAYILAFLGWPVFGGVIAFCSLICHMVCLGRAKRPFLIYYPYIEHRAFVGISAVIGLFLGMLLSRYSRTLGFIAPICFGAMFYYFACAFIYSRIARIKWLASDCLIRKDGHPILFWIITGVFSLLGVLLILSPFWAYALKDLQKTR